MVESMLEPHMKNSEAQASQFEVSMTFLLLGGCYTVIAPIAGYVSKPFILCLAKKTNMFMVNCALLPYRSVIAPIMLLLCLYLGTH